MRFYDADISDVLAEVKSARGGLSASESEQRLAANGKNRLAEGKKTPLIIRFLSQMADPMIIILIAAAAVSGLTSYFSGENEIADVIIIVFVVLVNAILGVYQESKAEHAIEALQEMAAATSRVLRDGKICVVRSEELVVGDVVLLEAGESVPADGRIIENASLKIEEASLTGESVPVNKFIDVIGLGDTADVPLGDRKNMAYMGSSVVYGRGVMVVTGAGMNTEMGKIADALTKAEDGKTPLQLKLSQLSKILTVLVVVVCALIFVVGLIRGGSINREMLLHSFMIAISLAVAAIPEGLVAVVTIVLSIGVTNMSKRNAIIRKLTAVETLGCTQIICSDKTGTLTQNKMTVVEHYGDDEKLLASAMALCSDAELIDGVAQGEPTEAALVAWAQKSGMDKPDLKEKAPRVGEAPFDSVRKMMSTVHNESGRIVQYTKGAPDSVIALCTSYLSGGREVPLDETKRAEIMEINRSLASKALRILAAAKKIYPVIPAVFEAEELERELCFIGLAGMIDPVRPEVKAAIEECRSAGIRPIMITGDHIDTAVAIATELQIYTDGALAVTGSELGAMSDEEFGEQFQKISVYARVQPEHKVRIVSAWRAAGYVTAMTGDGVNDAPSIKSADIGVGMGITGTDVTKNVADMVLADDNFATIVGAVEEGRRIYDNIKKVIQFLFSSNLSEVLSIFAASIMGFIILEPVHLLWINLVTDCFPALALGVERAEPDIMQRKARPSSESILAGGMGVDVVYQGLMVTVLTMLAFFIGHYMETGAFAITNSPDGTTMAFLTMSMAEIFHSFNLRSQRKSLFSMKTGNKFLTFAAIGSLVSTTAVLYIPFLRDAFGFADINLIEYLVALALAICVIPVVECVKALQRKISKSKSA